MSSLLGRRVPRAKQPMAHKVFESYAEQYPERLALTCGVETCTYGELNARANQFAHYLIDRGVGEGSVVGICLDRSIEMMVSILGTLKAAAAYAPLDTSYPSGRLGLMISQLTKMKLIVASPLTLSLASTDAAEVLNVAEISPQLGSFPAANPVTEINGESICYVIFTSGSTGTPKAVAVRHGGWHNLLNWVATEFGLTTESSGLLMSSFGFDITQRGLMSPLFVGATLHLLPSRSFDVMVACRQIKEFGVRTLHCAPSALYLLLEHDPDALAPVELAFPGGEPIMAGRLAGWAGRPGNSTKLVNVYGVAECTDVATWHVLTDYDSYARGGVPIGRPIYNVNIHILDDELKSVAPDEVGEICISGVGVGAGYLNDAGMNAERFVKVNLADGPVNLYRTGDLGRIGPDGEVMYAGRADRQVKIRGMRVDLGDVEAALAGDQSIRQAVVLPGRGTGLPDIDLVAFVVPANGDASTGTETSSNGFDAQAVRRNLLDIVPAHMIPGRIITVPKFPLSPNGKIDRDTLAAYMRRPNAKVK